MELPSPTGRRSLMLLLSALLCLGFFTTSLVSYYTSKASLRDSILKQELPLTSDNIYSEIQKDLVRPVFISSMMASDTFLRDWAIHGEQDVDRIRRYLREVMLRYGTFTSFYVSETTRNYYHSSGVLKQVDEASPVDAWFFRVRRLQEPYEINVDPDMANRDTLTIFINYRVLDYQGRFIGTAGVGLNVDSVRRAIDEYERRYRRSITFVDKEGRVIVLGTRKGGEIQNIHAVDGLRDLAKELLDTPAGSYQYTSNGRSWLLNARYLPELKWYILVQKSEDEALAPLRRTLAFNLSVCAGVTLLVLLITGLTVGRYQRRLEDLAATDKLTGLINRQAFDVLIRQAISQARRDMTPLSVILLDIDHFKLVNDNFGHMVGDEALKAVARALKGALRESDSVCRWGGEEFLVVLKACDGAQAAALAEKLRAAISDDASLEELGVPRLTASLGVAQLIPGDSADSLVTRADAALYEAKTDGRDRVRTSVCQES